MYQTTIRINALTITLPINSSIIINESHEITITLPPKFDENRDINHEDLSKEISNSIIIKNNTDNMILNSILCKLDQLLNDVDNIIHHK